MPILRTRKGAALVEYGILAGLISVSSILAVLFLGDNTRLPVCIADAEISERVLGENVAPCVARIAPPPSATPTAPPPPLVVPVVVPSELAGFLNPTGPATAVEALIAGTPLIGHPNAGPIGNALCVALGYLGPASNLTTVTAGDGGALFLPGGRWIWADPDLTGPRWIFDAALAPYAPGDAGTPVVATLTCTQLAP